MSTTTPTKAVLFDLRAYLADNNVRRSIASFSVNYGSLAESVALQSFLIPPGGSTTITTPMNPAAVTMIRTDQPLTVVLTLRNTNTLTFAINTLFVIDDDVLSLALSASSSNPDSAQVTVLQG